ncbi:DUF3237 domain-containing protein [Steroidobacter flavus]|uniref:UPF0311 protein ACFPN2_23165 n=1 Tax=Steroidobacter flavus TaxID=1842136 RepID=A0ABV8SWN8_9GAMM
MNDISLRHLFTLTARVTDPPVLVSPTAMGYQRRIMRVSGGEFTGERLSGIVLSGGADALMIRPDGVLALDVRLMLQTRDGETIYFTYTGRRGGSPEVVARIHRGELIAPGEDYYRIVGSFEAPTTTLGWLNDIMIVGTGRRERDAAVYEIYEVL